MLAERTTEHQAMFREDEEAVFFSNNEELLEKCQYYLEHEELRRRIAQAGHERCMASDYSYEGRIRMILEHVLNG